MIRVLVSGGREYSKAQTVDQVMNNLQLPPGSVILHGKAKGLDTLVDKWASRMGYEVEIYPALWHWLKAPGAIIKRRADGTEYNALAGPQRNTRMLTEGKPDIAVIFPGGNGTGDMYRKVRSAWRAGTKITVLVVDEHGNVITPRDHIRGRK